MARIVRDVMTPDPYVAHARDSVRKVFRLLAEADVRHLPIVDEGALVGIISDRDLRGLFPSAPDAAAPQDERLLAQNVSALMSTDLLFLHPESEIVDAIDLMVEHRVGALPVVEADSMRLVGIVSYVDVLRAARELF